MYIYGEQTCLIILIIFSNPYTEKSFLQTEIATEKQWLESWNSAPDILLATLAKPGTRSGCSCAHTPRQRRPLLASEARSGLPQTVRLWARRSDRPTLYMPRPSTRLAPTRAHCHLPKQNSTKGERSRKIQPHSVGEAGVVRDGEEGPRPPGGAGVLCPSECQVLQSWQNWFMSINSLWNTIRSKGRLKAGLTRSIHSIWVIRVTQLPERKGPERPIGGGSCGPVCCLQVCQSLNSTQTQLSTLFSLLEPVKSPMVSSRHCLQVLGPIVFRCF